MAPEADVVLAIRYQLQKHGREEHFNRIRGHQNEERRFSELDREAQFNVLCDKYATQAANKQCKSELPYPGSKSMVSINGKWITINEEQRLTESSMGPEMKRYIMGRFRWSEENFKCINWEAIDQSRRGFTKRENITISKFMIDWVNLGHQKAKMAQ